MRLCSFEIDGRRTYGLALPSGPLVDLGRELGDRAPARLEDLIEDVGEGRVELAALARVARDAPRLSPRTVEWRPPLERPGKIIGVAINNRLGQDLAFRPFVEPAFFFKPRTSLIGHGGAIAVRRDFGLTHPEPELAVIIGRRGREIPQAAALDYVFGYSIMNDITSPGLKERDSIELITPSAAGGGYRDLMTWRRVRDEEDARSIYLTYHALSKGCDTFGPLGPWIVTADEIANPNALAIHSYEGDDLVFEDSTANLTFSVERIIAHASRYMTLEPGDIIHCGTAMRPAPSGKYRALTQWDLTRSGSTIAVEIEGVGRLENPVVCGC